MLTHLDHVIVTVRDLEAATQTLARLLGRGPSWRGEHPDLGTANALFRLSNTYVELLAPAGSGGFGDLLRVRLDAHCRRTWSSLTLGTTPLNGRALGGAARRLPWGAMR